MEKNEYGEQIKRYIIHSIYKDFFVFLKERGKNFWKDFCKYYIGDNKAFFDSYFQCFTYSSQMVRERVEKTMYEHYSYLEAITKRNPPEIIVERSIRKCIKSILSHEEINIYIIIGFFSADGFTIKIKGKPIIGIGLERMQHFSNLDIITAHEYAHLVRLRYGFETKNQFERTINEGIATVFSQIVFPEKTLPQHLFLSNAEFNSLLLRKDEIIGYFNETKGKKFYKKIKERERVKNFIGYFIVKQYLRARKDWTIDEILKIENSVFHR